jgi:hypothetical protein
MVDTTRFQVSPEFAVLVAEVAAQLAASHDDDTVSVLELTTYFPIDVERLGRVIESIDEEDGTISAQQRDGINLYQFDEPAKYIKSNYELSQPEYLENSGLYESLETLITKEQWVRKLRDQHELLLLMAEADESQLDLSYFVSRLDMSSAKIQSLLNDLDAECYIRSDYDEETDTLRYNVPMFEYPRERFNRNIEFVSKLDRASEAKPVWSVIVISALVLLAILVLFVL